MERRHAITWGLATSAYQVEGGIREHGRGPSIWDTFCTVPGAVAHGHTGDVACDHYARWPQDVELLGTMGAQAYRFSVAWPRVVPDGAGPVNLRGLDFYDRLVDALLDAGIEPWVTLYHWDLPQRLEDIGGWRHRDTAEAFARYAGIVAARLGDRVRHWITVNEPWVAAFLGHYLGLHAPGLTSLPAAVDAAHGLLRGHGLAAREVRAAASHLAPLVGITLDQSHAYAADPGRPEDVAAAHRYDGYHNRWFLDPVLGRGYPDDMHALFAEHEAAPPLRDGDLEQIAAPLDFLGINFYSPTYVTDAPGRAPAHARVVSGDAGTVAAVAATEDQERTGAGWLVEPAGLYDRLTLLGREYPGVPLAITENGAIYDDPPPVDGCVEDPARTSYLQRHIAEVERAAADGAPVIAYFAWSLLDNFEWAHGYDSRFGLVHVDFDTQQRTVKDSGRWYSSHIAGRVSASAGA